MAYFNNAEMAKQKMSHFVTPQQSGGVTSNDEEQGPVAQSIT